MSDTKNTILIFLVLCWWTIGGVAACSHYTAPATAPSSIDALIVGKVISGNVALEPGVDQKRSLFIVTPSYVTLHYWLLWQVKEQALTIERLRAIVEQKK